MSRSAMNDPGPAQLDLIRRYARTLREMHADAMAARGPRIGAREARTPRGKAPMIQAARAMTSGKGETFSGQQPPSGR